METVYWLEWNGFGRFVSLFFDGLFGGNSG